MKFDEGRPERTPEEIEQLERELDAMGKEADLHSGRKLTFDEQCTIVAILLQRPFLRPAIRMHFNLSANTVSQLSCCIKKKGLYYSAVYERYLVKGKESFIGRYYNYDLYFELMKLMRDHNLFRKKRPTRDQMVMRALREGTTRSRPD